MPFTTYTELKTSVADWLNRANDPVIMAAIPDFIALVEARFGAHEAIQYERRDSLVLNAASVTLPTDCREVRSLYFDDATRRYPIELRTPEEIDPTRIGPVVAGIPRKAAVTSNGAALIISPTPDTSYTCWIVYLTKLVPLATTSPNWLLTSYPNVYLYGSLCEAEPYLKNDERIPVWKDKLEEALGDLQKLVERRQFSGNTPVQRPRNAIG